MIKIDVSMLEEVGLASLPQEEVGPFLRHVYETLERRVGTHLAKSLSGKQLDAFEALIEQGDDSAIEQWMNVNVPGYKSVVRELFAELKLEIANSASAILDASKRNSDAHEG